MGLISKIRIDAVLAKLNDTYDHDNDEVKLFGLRYYVASGEKHEKYQCRKNVYEPKRKGLAVENQRGRSNKKKAGVVQIYDPDADNVRDIKKAHMVEFRDYKSQKWQRIWH